MAICRSCRMEMTDEATTTCRGNDCIRITAHNYVPTVRYPRDAEGKCPDCNVAPGGHQHPGCAIERCPVCDGQRISCRCRLR